VSSTENWMIFNHCNKLFESQGVAPGKGAKVMRWQLWGIFERDSELYKKMLFLTF
jgi:hypothetical protein